MIDIEFAEPLTPGVYLTEKKNIFLKEELEKCILSLTNNLPWIERMDIVDSEEIVATKSQATESYEMQFIEQAKRAVQICVPMLEENGVLIKRPIDYYAEMLKSDEHMAKIKESVIKAGKREEMRILIRKQREEKKFGKDVQKEVTLQRQKEKTEFLKDIKKYRKDPKSVDLQSTLAMQPSKSARQSKDGADGPARRTSGVNKKREFKNKKYSMGGKRSGMKRNTKESAKEMGEFNPQKHQKRQGFKKAGPSNAGSKKKSFGAGRKKK